MSIYPQFTSRLRDGVRSVRQDPKGHFRRWVLAYVALLCVIFTLLAYYPGYMSYDSVYQLKTAREGVVNNANPPVMSYVWRITDRIIPGPGGMLLLHVFLYWGALAAIVWAAFSRNAARCFMLLACGFLPPVFGLLGTIWKDVGMHCFLLAAIACAFLACKLDKLKFLLVSLLFLWMAAAYRHNALVAAVPLIALNAAVAVPLLERRYPRWIETIAARHLRRGVVTGSAALVCMLFVWTVQFVNSWGVADAELWRAELIHDIVGISVHQGVNLLPEEAITTRRTKVDLDDLKKIYVGEHLGTLYNPEARKELGAPDPNADAVLTPYGVPARKLVSTWVVVVLDHFGSYLYHRSHVISRLLVLQAGRPWYAFHHDSAGPFARGKSSFAARITNTIWFLSRNTYFYSAWIYYLLLAVVMVLGWLLPFRFNLFIELAGASGFLYGLANFVIAGSGDFRYNNWTIGACGICVTLALAGLRPAAVHTTQPQRGDEIVLHANQVQ